MSTFVNETPSAGGVGSEPRTAAEIFDARAFSERLNKARTRRAAVLAEAAGARAGAPSATARLTGFAAGLACGLALAAIAAGGLALADRWSDQAAAGDTPPAPSLTTSLAPPRKPPAAAPALPARDRPARLAAPARPAAFVLATGPAVLRPLARPDGFTVPRRATTRIARQAPTGGHAARPPVESLPAVIGTTLRQLSRAVAAEFRKATRADRAARGQSGRTVSTRGNSKAKGRGGKSAPDG